MPISYKNKIYTTLGTPTALSGDVVSATNSVGVPAKDYTVKGKTIVWNQLFDKSKFSFGQTFNGITSVNNGDGSFTLSGTSTGYYQYVLLNPVSVSTESSHKYLLRGCPSGGQWGRKWGLSGLNTDESTDVGDGVIITGATSISPIMYVWSPAGAVSNLVFKPQLFDLTQMFGSGNEPATVAQFRAMFPDDYYPYNAGELKTIAPTNVEASGVERFQMLDKSKYSATTTINGVTFTNNGDGTITYNGTTSTGVDYILQSGLKVVAGHKYFSYVGENTNDKISVLLYAEPDPYNTFDDRFPHAAGGISIALKNSNMLHYQPKPLQNISYSNFILKPQLFDLTQMFGAGNEPATPAEFWQKVPEKLYGYNPSAYRAANIPSSKYFPDGMRSAGSAYDEINFLSQKAIKRIGAVDMGNLNWGSNTGQFPSHSFYSPILADAKGRTTNIISNGKFYNLYIDNDGRIIAITESDKEYDSSEAFKAAMSGVMLYYELATPVETTITPPLQALSTYKGFNSFSAPNSLTQNGPLSVTYYAEGGNNPESGWLTSYKRKLYMGKNIEWNQLFTNSRTIAGTITIQNQNGIITINGTSDTYYINFDDLSDAMNQTHSYLLYLKILNNPDNLSFYYGWLNRGYIRTEAISAGETCRIIVQSDNYISLSKTTGVSGFTAGTVFNNVKIAVMVMDLTQMFGAGNEPTTVAEFWSYFDHKLYPYNPGETQPLFKISRKSQWKEK
uniref:Uncharacterized protein n=1 Tax=Myoviridae sp. ctj3P51 TaxID=2826687 RepID=A0A8S5NQ17_9CAUD|nr:MAG TPA: hypothetical protein [Myoviridae sp. ctj3P51]